VVAAANNTPFGMAAYVYSRDLGRAVRIAEQIESGMVGINRGLLSDSAAPFGGVKQSGVGRELGAYGMAEFVNRKVIRVRGRAS
jgi:succinate-semialdehyde dehydrogenase/glutarate-semialdehyde dehydrogenase